MTNQKGVDVGIQTETHWEDPKQRKYRRLKHKVLEFIAVGTHFDIQAMVSVDYGLIPHVVYYRNTRVHNHLWIKPTVEYKYFSKRKGEHGMFIIASLVY